MDGDIQSYLFRAQQEEITFPKTFANAVKYLSSDIQVSSSKYIGKGFNNFDGSVIHHDNCRPSNAPKNESQTLSEDLAAICGENAVRFHYDYTKPKFKESEGGQIRVSLRDDNYIKKFGPKGTFAFRFDSVLSHLSILHGAYHDLRYGLKPGQLLPARHTDESVRAGIYFYGSLSSCRRTGDGHWTLLENTVPEQTRRFCNLGVITILHVTNVIAGPKGSSSTQWAKCGSSPTNAYVVGAIVTQTQIEAFNSIIDIADWDKMKSFLCGIREILHSPSEYLLPESVDFLRRYTAGGVFLAHADWIPLRCVTVAKFNPTKKDSWIADHVIRQHIATYIRDGSFNDVANQSVVEALRLWILGGLSNVEVIKDPSTFNCYTIREVANMKADNKFFDELVMAPCELTYNYLKAVSEATDYQHRLTPPSKRRKITHRYPEEADHDTTQEALVIVSKPIENDGEAAEASTEPDAGGDSTEVQTKEGIDPGGLFGDPLEGRRGMQGGFHRDSREVSERPFNKYQLILIRDRVLGRYDLHPTMRFSFEQVLQECIDETDWVSGETTYSLRKRMVERLMQHKDGKSMYESGYGASVEASARTGEDNSTDHSHGGGPRRETSGSVSTEELSSQDSGRAFDKTESIAYYLSQHTALAVYHYLNGFQTLSLAPGKFVKKRRGTMMKFLLKELKRNPSSDLAYLVKAVTKHIIGDRFSWGLCFKTTDGRHPFWQVGADDLRMVFGLNIHIEVIASDIVRAANVDLNKQ